MLKVTGTEFISGISGESESNIRDLFNQAAGLAPCIIFIDEIDSITPKRENAQREMERRVVAQLLSCVDGNYFSSFYLKSKTRLTVSKSLIFSQIS
jgi:ribosome biogenesis ATPase